MNRIVTQRLTVLIPLGLVAFALATSAGCSGRASRTRPAYSGAHPPPRTTKTKAAPRRAQPRAHWRDELAGYHTIANLWNAIDRHHDALGYALHPKYPTTTIVRPRPRPRPRRRLIPRPRLRPRPHDGTSKRPGASQRPAPQLPPRIDRPPVHGRAQAPLCRRACNHVRAICYAAGRICRIARRLRGYRAQLICKRATARCADARRAARRRCRSCG